MSTKFYAGQKDYIYQLNLIDDAITKADAEKAPIHNPVFTGIQTAPYVHINRESSANRGIQWYNTSYNAWTDYMAPPQASQGPKGNLTAPSGALVTSWAKRSFIENVAGYGWTFESGASTSTTPTIVAEIRSSDGAAKFGGTVTAPTFSATTLNVSGLSGFGKQEAAAGTAGTVTRMSILPYGHTGGPWHIQARDTIDSAFLRFQYGGVTSNLEIKHDGSLALNGGNLTLNSSHATINGSLTVNNGSRIVVQDGVDGGNSRGLFMWAASDSNWGIYMGQAGAGKALNGGTAPASIDGRTSHHIRFRVVAGTGQGFLWENTADETIMSLTGDSGRLFTKGGLTTQGNILVGKTADSGVKLQVHGGAEFTGGHVSLNDQPLMIRGHTDHNHKLAWDSSVDGPSLQGAAGGKLRTAAGGDVLVWNTDTVHLNQATSFGPVGVNNVVNGKWNPLSSAAIAGKKLYSDEEFAFGTNSVQVYNNSGGTGVVHTRIADATAPNKSGFVIEIKNDGVGATSPGLGGFVQNLPHATNKIFVQRFKAKLPVGYQLWNAENSLGTNGQTYWITSRKGTGKWEEYVRIAHCGDSGTFAGGGHVYVSGPAGAFTWHLASCTAFDVTERVRYLEQTGQGKVTITNDLDAQTKVTIGNIGRGDPKNTVVIGGNLGTAATHWNNAQLELRNTDAGTVGLNFHRSGHTSNSISVTDNTGIRIDGHHAWHKGNTGTAGASLIGYTPLNKAGDKIAGDGTIVFGPNTTWAESLRIGGNGTPMGAGNTTASVATTNGNLHLDSKHGPHATYINYYSGTGGTRFGNGNGGDVAHIDSNGSASFNGNVVVGGNLTVNGTTTTVNSTTITVDDPVITLGGDLAPTADDNKDRGVEFRWHNGTAAKVGFFGFDDSTGKFTFIPDATNTSEVFSGSTGTIDVNRVEANTFALGNSSFYKSGDGNHIHVNAPSALIPQSQTTANNTLLGNDGYRWRGIYGGELNMSGTGIISGNLGLGAAANGYGLHLLGGGAKVQHVATPAAPTVANVGTAGTTTYSYYVVAEDRNGRVTMASPVGTTTTGHATLDATNYNRVTWTAVSGAARYFVYRGTGTRLGATTGLAFNDQGQAGAGIGLPSRNETADVAIDGITTTNGLTVANGYDLHLQAASGSSDSGDLVFLNGAGGELHRLWPGNGTLSYRTAGGTQYNMWHSGNTGTAGANVIGYTPVNKAGDTLTGIVQLKTGSAGMVAWNTTTPATGKGTVHIGDTSATASTGGAITFGARDSGGGDNAQAGIYTISDGTYGTKMYLATTDSYATGSKSAVEIDHLGNVKLLRGTLTANVIGNLNGYKNVDNTNESTIANGFAGGTLHVNYRGSSAATSEIAFYNGMATNTQVPVRALSYRIQDSNTVLQKGGGDSLAIVTPSGYLDLGAQNAGHAHYITDRPTHYFNTTVDVNGTIRVYNTNSYINATEARVANKKVITEDAPNDGMFALTTIAKSLTLTTGWQDTGINNAQLKTGSYMVQVHVDDNAVGGGHYNEIYTGVMSWFDGGTNSGVADEITLHRAGHAPNSGAIFLRTIRTADPDALELKLQISGATANTGASTYTFKFRKMI